MRRIKIRRKSKRLYNKFLQEVIIHWIRKLEATICDDELPKNKPREGEMMQRPFSEEDMVHILKLCDGDKA